MRLISAVTPRTRSSLPRFRGSKGQLQSEMAILLPLSVFQPTDGISVKGTVENTYFFIAFILSAYYYIYSARKSQSIFQREAQVSNYYLFFKRSRISSKRRVFAVAFASASAAAFAAASAAAASSAAFFAFASSTRCA